MQPVKLKPFVRNRVTEIQIITKNCHWRHVTSKDNPGDCLLRGIAVGSLHLLKSWWYGPPWFSQHSTSWPAYIPEIVQTVKAL